MIDSAQLKRGIMFKVKWDFLILSFLLAEQRLKCHYDIYIFVHF